MTPRPLPTTLARIESTPCRSGRLPVAFSLALTLLAVGCGGSDARLEELRCAGDCQDLADPFLLTFELEVSGSADVLRGGELQVRIDEREAPRRPLGPLIVGASRIAFDLDLPSDLLINGQKFTVAAKAWDGLGRPTNEVTLELVIQL